MSSSEDNTLKGRRYHKVLSKKFLRERKGRNKDGSHLSRCLDKQGTINVESKNRSRKQPHITQKRLTLKKRGFLAGAGAISTRVLSRGNMGQPQHKHRRKEADTTLGNLLAAAKGKRPCVESTRRRRSPSISPVSPEELDISHDEQDRSSDMRESWQEIKSNSKPSKNLTFEMSSSTSLGFQNMKSSNIGTSNSPRNRKVSHDQRNMQPSDVHEPDTSDDEIHVQKPAKIFANKTTEQANPEKKGNTMNKRHKETTPPREGISQSKKTNSPEKLNKKREEGNIFKQLCDKAISPMTVKTIKRCNFPVTKKIENADCKSNEDMAKNKTIQNKEAAHELDLDDFKEKSVALWVNAVRENFCRNKEVYKKEIHKQAQPLQEDLFQFDKPNAETVMHDLHFKSERAKFTFIEDSQQPNIKFPNVPLWTQPFEAAGTSFDSKIATQPDVSNILPHKKTETKLPQNMSLFKSKGQSRNVNQHNPLPKATHREFLDGHWASSQETTFCNIWDFAPAKEAPSEAYEKNCKRDPTQSWLAWLTRPDRKGTQSSESSQPMVSPIEPPSPKFMFPASKRFCFIGNQVENNHAAHVMGEERNSNFFSTFFAPQQHSENEAHLGSIWQ